MTDANSVRNRMSCEDTTNTCGPCLASFPYGISGDSNQECTDGARRSLVVSQSSTSSISWSPKLCPADCSNNGTCVYTAWDGAVVSTCDVLDTSCSATCKCNPGFYSRDCSKNVTAYNISTILVDGLCNNTYHSLKTADVTESMVNYYALTISDLLRDMSQVSENALFDCSNTIFDLVSSYPALAVLDSNMKYVVDALSAILERGSELPDSIYDNIIISIRTLNEYRQMVMSPGEDPVEFYTKNLRYYVSVEYLGQFDINKEWVVAQSALERLLNVDSSSVILTNEQSLNNSIASTTAIVGLGLWEVLTNTKQNGPSDSSLIELETRLISGSISGVPATRIVVVLLNHEGIFYDDAYHLNSNKHSGKIDCYYRGNSLPYNVSVSCQSSYTDDTDTDTYDIVLTCPGDVNTYIEYTCPYVYDKPECSLWDPLNAQYVSSDYCTVISYDNVSTTCLCDGTLNASTMGRRLQHSAADPETYDFVSKKVVASVTLETTVVAYVGRSFGDSDNVVIFIMTLMVTLLAVFGAAYLMSRHSGDSSENKYSLSGVSSTVTSDSTYFQVLNTAAHILCAESGHYNVYERLTNALLSFSPYFSVLRWKQTCSEREISELLEKWIIILGYILNVMFIHAVIAYEVYDDDGYCQNIDRPDLCENRESQLSASLSRCEWRYDGNPYCALRSPLSSVLEVFLLFLIASVVLIPLNYMWMMWVRALFSLYMVDYRSSNGFPIIAIDSGLPSQALYEQNPKDVHEPEILKGKEDAKEFFKSTSGKGRSSSKHYLTVSDKVIALDLDVEHEMLYLLSESKDLVISDDLDGQTMTSDAMHRIYVKKKLRLDVNGNIKEGKSLIPVKQCSRDRIKAKIRCARCAASGVVEVMSTITDEELMNSYLIVYFFISCLPEALRYFALKYFFTDKSFYAEWSEAGPIHLFTYRYSALLLPIYVLISLLVVINLGTFNL